MHSIWSVRVSVAAIVLLELVVCLTFLLLTHSVKAAAAGDLGKLAYISGGNLWVRTMPDGTPKQLTNGGGNSRPRWSPSGEWIALRRGDGRIWVLRDTGEYATALGETSPDSVYAWSPVTDTLAFITARGTLSIARAPDWHAQPVTTVRDEHGYVFPFVWSPDGEWLAYEDDRLLSPMREGEYPLRYTSLQRIRPDGRDRTELVNAGNPSDYGLIPAGWSHDSHVYYWIDPVYSGSLLADGTQLLSVSPDGRTTKLLGPDVGMLAYRDFWSESPDGKNLALAAGGGRETWSHKRIALVARSNGQLTYLTDAATSAFSPAWSPDSEHLAYVAAPDTGFVGGGSEAKAGAAQRRIWIMNQDGADQHALTNDAAYRDEFPQWSPDGRFILFARLNTADEASVWLVPSSGGAPQQVAAGLGSDPLTTWFGYYGYIDWSERFDWWKEG